MWMKQMMVMMMVKIIKRGHDDVEYTSRAQKIMYA